MQAYDRTLDPPAPVASVTLTNPDSGTDWDNVSMLIDTGADVSLVPEAVLGRLELETVPDQHYELLGFGGGTTIAPVVRLEISFLGRIFRGQFLLTEQEFGILGRNILNSIGLFLDGPNLIWDLASR